MKTIRIVFVFSLMALSFSGPGFASPPPQESVAKLGLCESALLTTWNLARKIRIRLQKYPTPAPLFAMTGAAVGSYLFSNLLGDPESAWAAAKSALSYLTGAYIVAAVQYETDSAPAAIRDERGAGFVLKRVGSAVLGGGVLAFLMAGGDLGKSLAVFYPTSIVGAVPGTIFGLVIYRLSEVTAMKIENELAPKD